MGTTQPAPTERARSVVEKGGGGFAGIRMLLCENPLPPLDAAIEAAQAEMPRANLYTEPYSSPLRRLISELDQVPEDLIHINAGSELILRQLFDRFGQRVHVFMPTYALFPEIARQLTVSELDPDRHFTLDLTDSVIPRDATLVAIVTPNNPTGTVADLSALPDLLRDRLDTMFLVDEAFFGMGAPTVAPMVGVHTNLVVTRTLSKAQSLAGLRVGYAFCPAAVAADLNKGNDAYPLARPSQAAAIATLQRSHEIAARATLLRGWAGDLATGLRRLGVRTFPSETYFFLADFAPHDAHEIVAELSAHGVLLKPLDDPRLGHGMIRVTTALPEDNARVLGLLEQILQGDQPPMPESAGGEHTEPPIDE